MLIRGRAFIRARAPIRRNTVSYKVDFTVVVSKSSQLFVDQLSLSFFVVREFIYGTLEIEY